MTKKLLDERVQRQYDRVVSSDDGKPLLLAVRKYVGFLDSDLQVRRCLEELDHQWELANQDRRMAFNKIRAEALALEQRLQKIATTLDQTIGRPLEPSETPYYGIYNDLSLFINSDLDRMSSNARDDLEPVVAHLQNIQQTQTGVICNHLWSYAQRLNLLAQSIAINAESASELFAQADTLLGQYIAARYKLNYDYESSGQYALRQLQIVAAIVDGSLFTKPANLKYSVMSELSQWKMLMLRFAPSAFRDKIKSALFNVETEYNDLERDVYPLIRRYTRQIYEELRLVEDNIQQAEQELMTAPTTNDDIVRRLDRMGSSLSDKLDDLRRGQTLIFRNIPQSDTEMMRTILTEAQNLRITQQDMYSTIDAVRRALRYIQNAGVKIADEEVEQALKDIYEEVTRGLSFQEQFELSLPIIPLLLSYKVALGGEVDLGAVWKDWKTRFGSK